MKLLGLWIGASLALYGAEVAQAWALGHFVGQWLDTIWAPINAALGQGL